MLDALAQTTYTYTTTTTSSDGTAAGLFAGVMLFLLFLFIPLLVFQIVCWWKIFEKAGVEGWKALIPVYDLWVLAEISGKPGWWGLFISLVGVVAWIPLLGWAAAVAAVVMVVMISIELAKKFGKDPVFALLLIFLQVVGYAILAFGSAKYDGKVAKTATPAKA